MVSSFLLLSDDNSDLWIINNFSSIYISSLIRIREAHIMAAVGFLSCYMNGPLPYV